jgi:hypothetical protein
MLALTLVLLSVSGDLGTPHGARLLTDAPLLAQAPLPVVPQAEPSDAQVSAQQLQVDIDAIKRLRPGLGGGVALVSTGGGFAVFGGFFMLMAGLSSSFTGMLVSNPLFVLAIGSFVIGAPLLVVGIWLLVTRIEQRQLIDTELGKLRQQLQKKQQEQRGPGAPVRPIPYPGYAPVPQVFEIVEPVTLATF